MINRKSDRTMRRTDTAFYHTSQTPKSQPARTASSSSLPQIGPPQTYGDRQAKTTAGFFLPPMIEGS